MSWGETVYLKKQFEKQLVETQEAIESVLHEVEGQIPVVATDNGDNSPNGVALDDLAEGNTWFIIEGEEEGE
jgi:microcystin degradation protein MlrC